MLIDLDTGVELLTVSEVAKILKISATSVRRLQSARRIPFVKVGGSVRFVRNDIALYLTQRRVDAVDR